MTPVQHPSQPTTPIQVRQEPLIDPRTGGERKRRYVSVLKAEKWWVEKARIDPAFFIHYITGLEPAKHHRMWLAQIFHPERKRINLIAPRESGKSTILVYAMAYWMGRFPLSTNAIVSVASDQAEKRMRMIHSTVNDNLRYRNVFPHIHIDTHYPDTQTEFTIWSSEGGRTYNNWRRLVEQYGSSKDPSIRISGRTGRVMIGSRLSGLLLLDDIIDHGDLSDKAQDDVEDYIVETLLPAVTESGRVVNIGTRWMLGDIPERLRDNPEWHTLEIQATLYDKAGKPHSYWPKWWPLDRLARKRREMNNDAKYFVMYENNPTAMQKALFREQDLRRDLPIPLPRLTNIFIGTDWATSTKASADFSVFAALGIDDLNNVFLLDMKRKKADPDTAVNTLIEFANDIAERYQRLDNVLIENVAFQTLFMQLISKVDPRIPTVGVVPKGDKGHRASFVSAWSRNGKFFINQAIPDLEQLISEWMNFDMHRHDDTLDAVSILFQHLNLAVVTTAEVTNVTSEYLL